MYRIDLSLALECDLWRRNGPRRVAAQVQERADGRDDAGLHGQPGQCWGGHVRRGSWLLRELVAAASARADAARLLSAGCQDRQGLSGPQGIKSNAGLDVPVVAVGKLGYPDLAERALRDGLCDMIMLARPLLADPDWPRKAFAGQVAEIRPCIGDQEGCINEFIHGGHIQCTVNPRTGFEELLPPEPPAAVVRTARPQPRKVAVVGAGPAGIVCACTAAERGLQVTVFDGNDRAGGMLIPGSVPKIKFDVANYAAYLEQLLLSHARDYELVVRLSSQATAEMLPGGPVRCCGDLYRGQATGAPGAGCGSPARRPGGRSAAESRPVRCRGEDRDRRRWRGGLRDRLLPGV